MTRRRAGSGPCMGPDAERAQQDTPGAAPASGTRLRDMVVVGASAGGVQALRELVRGLPADLPAALMIVLHMSPEGPGALTSILRRVASLDVSAAEDMAPVRPGCVYVARPDCHLLLRDGEVRLGRGPRENGHRPAVDPLFRSAARWYGPRAVAVVLSGTLDDGAAGALTIAQRGGAVAIQDPADALYDGMPRAALRAVGSAVVAPVTELSGHITRLVQGPAGELAGEALHQPERPGVPSGVSCPDCHGVLYELDGKDALRYRCRVGHAWSPESLEAAKDDEVEDAIWVAVRNLEERSALYQELAERSRFGGRSRSAGIYEERWREASRAAEVIRGVLASGRLGLAGGG